MVWMQFDIFCCCHDDILQNAHLKSLRKRVIKDQHDPLVNLITAQGLDFALNKAWSKINDCFMIYLAGVEGSADFEQTFLGRLLLFFEKKKS